ncbi:MAG TPA: DUF1902 domain-containing protein [Terriglobales bacterium]|nr:DUF1902 domain-containing protein [Terriglobales bacterium]
MYTVKAEWDDDANVWVATSDDVPGLATEAPSLEHLLTKLRAMVPEMLELNGVLSADQAAQAAFRVIAEHCEQRRAVA